MGKLNRVDAAFQLFAFILALLLGLVHYLVCLLPVVALADPLCVFGVS